MSLIPEARAGKVEENEAKSVLIASRFPFAEKVIDYLQGGTPVEAETAVNKDDSVSVKINEFPFFTTEDERPFAQVKAEYKIRQKSPDDLYTLSLFIGEDPASLMSRTDISIDSNTMDSIKELEECEHCGVVDLQSKMLMALFAESGDFVYFTAGLREKRRPPSIRRMLESGIKEALPEHKPEKTKPEPPTEEPEKIIDIDKVEEKPEPPKPEWDPNRVLEAGYLIKDLGMGPATLKEHKEELTVDGKYMKGKVAAFNVRSKGIRLTPKMRIKRLKKLGLNIETLEEAAETLGKYGIIVEPGIKYKKAVKIELTEPTHIETQYSEKKMSDEQIAKVLGIGRSRITDYISKGLLGGRTVGDVAERIRTLKRKKYKTKLEIYNQLVIEAEIKGIGEFSSEDVAYSTLTKGIKKKLD